MVKGEKLSKNEPTVRINVRLPVSIRDWYMQQPGGMSTEIRRHYKERMWEATGTGPKPMETTDDGRRRWLTRKFGRFTMSELREGKNIAPADAAEALPDLLATIDELMRRTQK